MVLTKRCPKCDLEKPRDEFYNNRRMSDGLTAYCRPCWKRYGRDRRDRAREITMVNVEPDARFFDFANLVKTEREKLELTQEQLGELVGVGGTQVRAWEKSKGIPRQKTLRRLCELFGVEIPMSVKGSDHGHIPLGVRHCVRCGKRYPLYLARVRHCSRECSAFTSGEKQLGENNHAWKGGRTSSGSGGYKMVKAPDHPAAYSNGYILEHRLLMERALGRLLEPHERVHHRNGDRADNRIKPGHEDGSCPSECCNLELWKVGTKDPPGVRARDYHCPGCRCGDLPL